MQNDEHAEAAERELHYSRLAGDSPTGTAGLDWALILVRDRPTRHCGRTKR